MPMFDSLTDDDVALIFDRIGSDELDIYFGLGELQRACYLIEQAERLMHRESVVRPSIWQKIQGRRGLSMDEIAEVLGIAPEYANMIYKATLRKLRLFMIKREKFKREFLDFYFK